MAVDHLGDGGAAARFAPAEWRPSDGTGAVHRLVDAAVDAAPRSGTAPPALRPVRLPGEPELAGAARDSGVLADLVDLAARVRDSDRAGPPVSVASGIWALAYASGVLRTRRGPDGMTRDEAADLGDTDAAVLQHWLGVHVAITELAEYPADIEGEGRTVAERVLAALLFGLYQGDSPAQVEPEVARLAVEVLEEGDTPVHEHTRLRAVVESAVHGALAQLAHHRSLTLHRGGRIELTPLGRWAVNRELNGAGISAPVLGGYANASPAALLDAVAAYPENERFAEFRAWLGRRSQHDAAAALLTAAGAGGFARRGAAADLLRLLGPAAEPAVRAGLADPLMWRHCCAWLTDRGLPPGRPLADADLGWLLIDQLLAAAGRHGPQDFIRRVDRLLTRRDIDLIVGLPNGAHPERRHALRLVADFHPDPRAAEAARTALA
ncbi:hypothetical protein CLV63_110145 [Murinocardiopsis flavida]|uniref:Uncharacterized protein n=1 Tax=Murinocardiopsis flavida TaxID=645275 RepID=A0A2P8DI00_9ACTN|nr:hypothetical protein [Murinocardiopsis flavida]PSK96847.1 hypothetical protein CLV63_110145 [Murinocardiopsis flavida]